MGIGLYDAIDYNFKSINYTTICLYTSWQIATAGHFKELFSKHKGKFDRILILERRSAFVHQIVFTNWRMFVIEVYKIFDPNSKQGISKIINKILNKEKGYKIDNYNRQSIEDLKHIYEQGLVIHGSTLTKIKILRDKYYAHRDDEFYTQIDREVKFTEGNELLEFAKTIILKICELVNIDRQFKTPEDLDYKTGVRELIILSKLF